MNKACWSGREIRDVLATLLLAFSFFVVVPVQAQQVVAPDLANAEVIVTSSMNADYVGMTNTDERGHFMLNGVPAGGINVILRKSGVVIARGAGVIDESGNLNEAQMLNITLARPENTLKSVPIAAMRAASAPGTNSTGVSTTSVPSSSAASTRVGKTAVRDKPKRVKRAAVVKRKPPR